jgi:leader peptidase (prepilin peptidase)/N-methyltransferase
LEYWWYVAAGLFGAVIGSFLNVVIYRLPLRQSLVFPPSHCFSCGHRLETLDLFPVLSYLLLRGRCRHCGRRFSPRYALVELVTAGLALGAVHSYGLTLYAAVVFVACCALLVAFFIDFDHMIIPDEVPLLLIALGLAVDVSRLWQEGAAAALQWQESLGSLDYSVHLPSSVVGAAVGAGVFLVIGWLSEKIFRKPALGMGDVKLAGGLGALLGPGYGFLSFFLWAVLVGAAVAFPLLLLRHFGKGDTKIIPFGPMMALAGIGMLLWPGLLGPLLLRFYVT